MITCKIVFLSLMINSATGGLLTERPLKPLPTNYLEPTQILNTNLTLTVRDGLGNTVEGAAVTLYEKKEDYLSEKNGITSEVTNKKGVAMFKKLEPKEYFILARKEEADNRAGGESLSLKKGRINKATVVIE